VIVGAYGSGKTTLARRLGALTGARVYHLDATRWDSGWVLRPRDEWLQELDGVLAGGAWIVDGNFEATLERRLAACDVAVFLDFPLVPSAWRVLRRRFSRAARPDLPAGVAERPNLRLLGLLRDYRRTTRPELERLLAAHASHVTVLVARNDDEVERVVEAIAQRQPTASDSRFQT
jgi:adenylate kinase family enzyme